MNPSSIPIDYWRTENHLLSGKNKTEKKDEGLSSQSTSHWHSISYLPYVCMIYTCPYSIKQVITDRHFCTYTCTYTIRRDARRRNWKTLTLGFFFFAKQAPSNFARLWSKVGRKEERKECRVYEVKEYFWPIKTMIERYEHKTSCLYCDREGMRMEKKEEKGRSKVKKSGLKEEALGISRDKLTMSI